jgi:predicted aspartyl protease
MSFFLGERMEILARKLLVKAKLTGRKFSVSEAAIIDTGAAFIVIPPETADFLELELNKDYPKATLVTASGIIETPVKIVNKIEVGNTKVENLPVVIRELPLYK